MSHRGAENTVNHMPPHTLVRWDAEAIAGWEREAPAPADDPQARIVIIGPETDAHGAVEAIPTWQADTPPGSWVELQLRARFGDRWSRFYRVAAWDGALTGSRRGSFDAQADADGQLATDTLLLTAPADALQARALLCAEPGADMPELEALAICLTAAGERPAAALASQPSALSPQPAALTLPLLLSQYSYPDGGAAWCSPTTLTMALAYWHARGGDPRLEPFTAAQAVPDRAVPLIFDPGWDGTGNWAFNTALAASLGLTSYVTRLHSLEQLARWTAAGVPVPISIRWEPGELDGPIERSSGHITLVTGVAGDRVLMAEPAGRDESAVAFSYRADQLYACWQRASRGAVYILHPPGWPRPEPGEGDAWV
jgi:hypothetical protein